VKLSIKSLSESVNDEVLHNVNLKVKALFKKKKSISLQGKI
jgi:hypothetical protein